MSGKASVRIAVVAGRPRVGPGRGGVRWKKGARWAGQIGRSQGYRAHLHLLVDAVVEEKVMRHAHAVGLHRVTLPVVKVAHIGVVEVRDLLLARHRPRAAPRLRVLLASAGKQDWSGGFARARWREGEGGPSRIAREARRASKRTNVGCVRPREAARRRRPREIARQCPGAGTGKSRCQGYPDNEAGERGIG